ncbi:MAG: hypothetical protein NWR72_01320, partial [Bacteroidia bacterium]|nr:hypothetical protein [Bacteroidia bacterium]
MKRIVALFGFLLAIHCLIGQPGSQTPASASDSSSKRVKILNADILKYQRVNGVELQKLIGHVKILQDSTLFYCDSAYYFESENRLEAYRNVRVEMPDSVTMVADRAIYNSETRIAEVYDNITLTDASVTLTTNRLTYDRNQSFGFYKNGGKLVDEDTELTSQLGYYYPDENMAYFRKKVVLTSPDYTLKTDTLAYDTESKIARFVTLTQIISEGGDIETTSGNYDTEARRVNLFARSQVKDSTYTLSADTLFYDDGMNLGYAIGRVVVDQTDTTLQIRGNYGEFNRETDESLVTNNPVAVQVFESDTLFLFADTLKSYIEQRIDTIRYRFLDNSILKKYLPPTDSSITDSLILDSIKVSNKLLAIRLQDSLGVDTSR